MTESEARNFTSDKERLSLRRAVKDHLRRLQDLDGVSVLVEKDRSTPDPPREVWTGKGYELAAKVRAEFEKTGRPSYELTAAYEQACRRYVQKNGKLFTPKVLREGLRRKDDEASGYRRGR